MAKEPDHETLKKQIRTAVAKYDEMDPRAAMLSGMSLAANFLAKCDGGKLRPQDVVNAVSEVAAEAGYAIGRL